MGYKLVVLDLDGTLLARDKHIADSTLELIGEAKARGVKFTIATGRMTPGALRYAEQLKVDIPIITYNGALVRNVGGDKIYREYKVPASWAVEAVNILKDHPVLPFAFIDDKVYTDTEHEWTERYAQLLEVEMNFVGDVRAVLTEDPTMLVFMVPVLKGGELTRLLKEHMDSQVRITNSTEWFLDVLHVKASKGLALKQVSEHLGIAREEIIAIGDNSNDLEMIQFAGLGVAVSNASEDLIAAADYVAELPMHEGVEETLRKFILNSLDVFAFPLNS